MGRTTALIAGVGLMTIVGSLGCILENNPDFGPGASASADGGGSGNITATATATDSAGTDSAGGGNCEFAEYCPEIHVGPAADRCPHTTALGFTMACDEVGEFGVRIAGQRTQLTGAGRIVIHDDAGAPAVYQGEITLGSNVWVHAADGVPVGNVRLWCNRVANVIAVGDGIHVQGITLVNRAGCTQGFQLRTDAGVAGTETVGHMIENVVLVATGPDSLGSNRISRPFDALGADSTVRGSHIYGHWEGGIEAGAAHRTSVYGNTFAFWGDLEADWVVGVDGAQDFAFANNVVLSLARDRDTVVAAGAATQRLVAVGNVVEGLLSAATGTGGDPASLVADNVVGQAPLVSPRNPRFLMDGAGAASAMFPMDGTSLDGVALGDADTLPGAFQQRGDAAGPRRATIRVGPGADCGGNPCDVQRGDANEIQLAVWTAWPGSTVEVYEGAEPFTGPVVITWPVTVRGISAAASTRPTIGWSPEDDLFERHGGFAGHAGIISVPEGLGGPVTIENLRLLVEDGQHGIAIEGSGATAPPSSHRVARVHVEDLRGTEPPARGMWLGDRVTVTDSLIVGDFSSCVTFGPRAFEKDQTPATTSFLNNLTCRLETIDGTRDVAAIEVAGAVGGGYANLVIDMRISAPLFRAQRRVNATEPDLDIAPVALDAPQSFTASAVTVAGRSVDFDGFVAGPNYAVSGLDVLTSGAPLFVSALDSHLIDPGPGVDDGIDASGLDPSLSPGTSLDGIDRATRTPDRGAYEQGL